MDNAIKQARATLKRELEDHELEIIKLAYGYGRADAISKASEVLPMLKRREAKEKMEVGHEL